MQSDWLPYKKRRLGHRHRGKTSKDTTRRQPSISQGERSQERELNLVSTQISDSSFHNCESPSQWYLAMADLNPHKLSCLSHISTTDGVKVSKYLVSHFLKLCLFFNVMSSRYLVVTLFSAATASVCALLLVPALHPSLPSSVQDLTDILQSLSPPPLTQLGPISLCLHYLAPLILT